MTNEIMNNLKRLFIILMGVGMSFLVNAQTQEYSLHTISKGETIYSISNHYHIPISELVNLNPGCDQVIKVGQSLKIPKKREQTVTSYQPVRTQVTYHTIQSKETLFQLTRKYKVTAEAICQLNPGLSAENFQTGKTIAIPPYTGEIEKERVIETISTDRPAGDTNRCRDMHKIRRKETLYGIAKDYGVTEDELKEANPELKATGYELKKGHYLCIPYHVVKKVQKLEPTNEELFNKNQPQAQFYKTIRVGLMLPFSSNSKAKRYSAHLYYNGFMLAIDSLKNQGVSMDITVFDSGKNEEKLDSLFREHSMKSLNVLFCPQLELHESKVSHFSKQNQIRLVLTRSDDAPTNPYLFVTNPSNDLLYADVRDHFVRSFGRANIIILDMKDTNSKTQRGDFTRSLKTQLSENGISYKFLTISSSVEQIADALSSNKQNVIVVNSASIPLMKKLLPVWKTFATNHPQFKITFFGHQEWLREANEMKNTFYTLDVHIYSKWWFNPNNAASKQLAANYHKWYNSKLPTVMPSVPTIGFDTTYYILKGLSVYGTNFERNLENCTTKPYQNFIDFERVSNWGGMVNRKVAFIHFNKKVVSIEF